MKNTRHTPGPWEARYTGSRTWAIDAESGDPRLNGSPWFGLATAYGPDHDPEEGLRIGKANASLLAAAPEMEDLLAEMDSYLSDGLSYVGSGSIVHNRIKRLLAKARGELTPA